MPSNQELQQQIAALKHQNQELEAKAAEAEARANGEGGETGKFDRITGTQSTKAKQWPFMVHGVGSRKGEGGKSYPVKLTRYKVTACDESEAIRLYTLMEGREADGEITGERQTALDPSAWRFFAECTDPEREKLRRAKYERRGYGKPDTLPIPSGVGYQSGEN